MFVGGVCWFCLLLVVRGVVCRCCCVLFVGVASCLCWWLLMYCFVDVVVVCCCLLSFVGVVCGWLLLVVRCALLSWLLLFLCRCVVAGVFGVDVWCYCVLLFAVSWL